MSTVSNKFSTTPSSSTIGTELIPRSLKTCTTSNTLVCIVAVDSGQNRSDTPRLAAAALSISGSLRSVCGCCGCFSPATGDASPAFAAVEVGPDASSAPVRPVGVDWPPPSASPRGGASDCRLVSPLLPF